jgi:hypothetical protein
VLDCGTGHCVVEQIQNGDKVDVSEWFFTSGEDRIFPKGFPVGTVSSVALGTDMKDVKLNLSGAPGGVEEVLVVLQGVHQAIPLQQITDASTFERPLPPPPSEKENPAAKPGVMQTDADKLKQQYQKLGQEQGHVYGALASGLPNFNAKPAAAAPANPALKPATTPGSKPAAGVTPPATNQPAKPPVVQTPPVKPAPKPVLPLGAPRPPAATPPPQ